MGGAEVDKDTLRISLARSTYEIAKIGDDVFGLVEFYPHVKRGKKKRGLAENGSAQAESSQVEEVETTDDPKNQG